MTAGPLPLEELEASISDPERPLFLPPWAYTSAAFHEFELEAIWRREWLLVGRLEEIPEPGDYFSIEVAGEPLLVIRDDDGEVAAMSAVCRHRGMLVASGRGHCDRALVCPYHSWAYDRGGRLIGAPQAIEMTRLGIALPRLRTEAWNGFLFVNFDPAAEPLAPRLAPLAELVAPYELAELRGEFTVDPDYLFEFEHEWNWKVYADGQNECYHCDKLHGETPLMQHTDCNSIAFGVMEPEHGVFHYELHNRDLDVTLNHLGRAIFDPIPGLSEEQRRVTQTVTIAPGVLLVMMPDSVISLGYFPLGPTSMRVKRHRLYPPRTLARPDFVARHREETEAVRTFVGQDEWAFERVQRGLRSGFAPRGPIAGREQVVIGMNRWLLERYRAAAGAAAPGAATAPA
ncbi:MAG: aromatic ring-hydroxylating dioxygenase subunit alpha [Actinobacteria bacterium]|nr:aromatic ring-hydroxylating dioxygenase subunit alpha [Actinomycetota bacterium]